MGLVRALAAEASPCEPLVHLVGHPRVSLGDDDVRLSESGMRVLAFVSLNEGEISRSLAATALWPDLDDSHAAGNLRTALWRVNGAGTHLVDTTRTSLRLAERVQVDARLLGAWAARILSRTARRHDLTYPAWDIQGLDLLPGWCDDWIALQRERLRQRLLHALEEMSRALANSGRCAEAVDVALVTVRADPLRESAQEVLIKAHLADGNRVQAWQVLDEHRAQLQRELGVEPSEHLCRLLTSGEVGSAPPSRIAR